MKFPSGNEYEGQWSMDRREGLGEMRWADRGERYRGGWLMDLQHGWGEHVVL